MDTETETIGKIVELVRERGFGWIDTGKGYRLFFHATELKNKDFNSLQGNEDVRITETRTITHFSGKKKTSAHGVYIIQ